MLASLNDERVAGLQCGHDPRHPGHHPRRGPDHLHVGLGTQRLADVCTRFFDDREDHFTEDESDVYVPHVTGSVNERCRTKDMRHARSKWTDAHPGIRLRSFPRRLLAHAPFLDLPHVLLPLPVVLHLEPAIEPHVAVVTKDCGARWL